MFAASLVAAFLALPVLAASAQQSSACTRNYTAVSGDDCDSISAANNVSTYQFAVVNAGIVDAACDNLQPGTSYCLGWPSSDCSDTYVVQANDTCDQIADTYSLNTTMLNTNNPQIDAQCDNIYIGEVLCVATTVQVPPAPSGSSVNTNIPSTATAAVPSPTSTDGGDDDDDGSTPYCDEL